ncbi:MAG: ABC transporter permease [Maritimibacter sp.]
MRESAGRERREKLKQFLTNWQAVIGLILVIGFFVSAIFAHWLAPYDPNAMDIPARLSGPTLTHLAGTDQLGRDTFSRIMFGGQVALKIAAIGVSVSLTVGLILGMFSGFGPRWLDHLLLLIFDTVRAFPTIVLALATVALTGPSLGVVLTIVIVTSIPSYARVARTATLALRNTDFIVAERSLGAGFARILLHHVMPNVVGPLLILAAMDVPVVVTVEAGLSFIGLGVLPPTASWGTILNEGSFLFRLVRRAEASMPCTRSVSLSARAVSSALWAKADPAKAPYCGPFSGFWPGMPKSRMERSFLRIATC